MRWECRGVKFWELPRRAELEGFKGGELGMFEVEADDGRSIITYVTIPYLIFPPQLGASRRYDHT
jgi:hypothetical protein